jgi:hypothetical protein
VKLIATGSAGKGFAIEPGVTSSVTALVSVDAGSVTASVATSGDSVAVAIEGPQAASAKVSSSPKINNRILERD